MEELLRKKVRKAIIPAAGLGTCFLPAIKAIAKEMLPIVDKPTFQFIVEEAKASGVEDILVVTGKHELLKLVEETTEINLHFICQSRPLSLSHMVLQAKSFVGNEPFVVMLGDDIMFDQVPLTKQFMMSVIS